MEAKDLMLGNYVNQGIEGIGEVSGYQLYQLTVKENGGNCADYYNDFKPIPLTEEWLLKFGFYQKENSSYWYPKKCWHRYTFGHNRLGHPYCNLEVKGENIPHATCYYVHQLQNLYHVLTGKDLIIVSN